MATKRAKKSEFPMTIDTGKGVRAKIYKSTQTRNGTEYTTFMVSYVLLGERKMKGFASLDEAITHAKDACDRIADGNQKTLLLNNDDAATYVRAMDHLKPDGAEKPIAPLDVVARDYIEVLKILAGRATPAEVARDWVKRYSTTLPRISVADAITKLKAQLKADGKSQRRRQQVAAVLDLFAQSFNCDVHTLSPSLLASYLSGLQLKERTKRNHRDVLGFFFRWLVPAGYLSKGTNPLEGVQKYSARKIGEIETYSPQDMARLLNAADKRLVPFLAIGAFAGLRHAEIARLDWSDIDFDDEGHNGKSEPVIEVGTAKSKNKTRRLVPIKATLRAWLLPHRKESGKVCPFANVTKQLLWLAEAASVEWKHNALRHSCISYRVAESGDIPRVADESDNSPAVIREHYLKRVKPRQAELWFNLTPENAMQIAAGVSLTQ
jgi:integrase